MSIGSDFPHSQNVTPLSQTPSTVEESASSSFHESIPVLDFSHFRDPLHRDSFLTQLNKACREVGFFALINSGIDSEILDKAYRTSYIFFKKSPEEKEALEAEGTGGQRGYVGGGEIAEGEVVPDPKEFLHIGPEPAPEGAPKNQWGTETELREAMTQLFSALDEKKNAILQALLASLKLDENLFSDKFQTGQSLLRALYYPTSSHPSEIWAAEHTDIDLFTILPRASAKGLQVNNAEKQWIDVTVPDHAVIINIGDMFQNFTNGYFKSASHRVMADQEGQERQSMVLFVHPDSKTDLSPLKEFCNQGALYPKANRKELLLERLATLGLLKGNDTLLEQLGACGILERLIELNRASPAALRAVCDAGHASIAVRTHLLEDSIHSFSSTRA